MTSSCRHPWIARIAVALTMIVLSFIGLIITDIRQESGWLYWRFITPLLAVLALWLSWYLKKEKHPLYPLSLWHEILHWTGLLASVLLLSFFVHIGVMGRLEAALATLTLLSQAVFLAGIYIERTFLYIGIILGLFTLAVAFLEEYLYAIAIPIFVLAFLGAAWMIWHTKKQPPSSPSEPLE